MVDQVNPTGGLASSIPLAQMATAAARPAPEKPSPAKTAARQPQGSDARVAVETAGNPQVAMKAVNEHLQQTGSQLRFQTDEATGRTVFKVVNPNTGEVLIQVPAEELLALARNLRALGKKADASGVLVDKEG